MHNDSTVLGLGLCKWRLAATRIAGNPGAAAATAVGQHVHDDPARSDLGLCKRRLAATWIAGNPGALAAVGQHVHDDSAGSDLGVCERRLAAAQYGSKRRSRRRRECLHDHPAGSRLDVRSQHRRLAAAGVDATKQLHDDPARTDLDLCQRQLVAAERPLAIQA